MGRWRWVFRMTWLQERGNKFGLHPKETQGRSDHSFRDSIPPEISHYLGIFGNTYWSRLAALEPSDLKLMRSILWFSVGCGFSLGGDASPCSPGSLPPYQHLPFPCVGLISQHISELWESLADYSWLSAQGRPPATDTPPLTQLRAGSPLVPGCWLKCYTLLHPLHEIPSK